MFDTMTMTKAVGAVCGSLLVFLLLGWAGNSLFTVGVAQHGGHEGEEIAQAYSIDTGEAEAPAEGAEEGPDFATLLASADAGAGEAVFKKCASCHKLRWIGRRWPAPERGRRPGPWVDRRFRLFRNDGRPFGRALVARGSERVP